MTMTPVLDTHIYLDDTGAPWIKRAGVSVKQVVASLRQLEYKPEEVVRQFPYLKLSEVYAALTYYYDHRSEIDAVLLADREYIAKARAEHVEPPITRRLRKAGKLP
jgi:uncharacterized protein (DUF433 family)